MISFFRRFASSKLGIAILGIIMIAFVVTLYEGRSGMGLPGATGSGIATVGRSSISEAEATRRVQGQLELARQQQPALDMTAFVAAGGADRTIEQLINTRAFEEFARAQGIVASKRLVDGAIASIPAFYGPNGKFDRTTFEAILQSRKLSEAQVRDDFAREFLTKALLSPVAGAARMTTGLSTPYAALMMETRTGQVVTLPSGAFADGPAPTDAEVQTFYTRNIARYTVPERRTIRYAAFDRSRFDGKIVPSEADIAAAYKADGDKYASRETRGFTQIIVAGQAEATSLLAKIKGGMAMADAAKGAGLEALAVPPGDKAAFARLTGQAVADAAFATPRGQLAPLTRSGLGYHIVRVDSIVAVPGKSLDQARGEIAAALTKTKVDAALADFVAKLDDAISGGATFDEIAKANGLAASTTPPITAAGVAPGQPGYVLPEAVKPLLRDAFQAETGDDPQVASTGSGNAYVLYHMDSVVPAAPRPLASIREQVAADALADRAARAARKAAEAIAATANKGQPLSAAVASAGVALPAPRRIGGRRIDVAQAGGKVPPAVLAMFSTPAKRARVVEADGGAGWAVVYVDSVTPATAQAALPLLAQTQQQLSQSVGEEYIIQFANAVKANVGVTRNDGAIAALKRAQTGQR